MIREEALGSVALGRLLPKVVAGVTDRGANMVATARQLGIRQIDCIAHSIQLVVNAGIAGTVPKKSKTPDNIFTEEEIEGTNALVFHSCFIRYLLYMLI